MCVGDCPCSPGKCKGKGRVRFIVPQDEQAFERYCKRNDLTHDYVDDGERQKVCNSLYQRFKKWTKNGGDRESSMEAEQEPEAEAEVGKTVVTVESLTDSYIKDMKSRLKKNASKLKRTCLLEIAKALAYPAEDDSENEMNELVFITSSK